MDYSWLRFSTTVALQSKRSVEECVRSLQSLIAPPNSYARQKRRLPFRGEVGMNGGSLRFPLFSFQMMTIRSLRFDLSRSDSGAALKGELKLLKRFRIPVMVYLALCCIGELYALAWVALHWGQADPFVLLGPLVSFAMIYGWMWLVVRFNRRADAQLTAAVKYAMESDELAKIMRDLFASSE